MAVNGSAVECTNRLAVNGSVWSVQTWLLMAALWRTLHMNASVSALQNSFCVSGENVTEYCALFSVRLSVTENVYTHITARSSVKARNYVTANFIAWKVK
jgi:hypothetical protein